MSLVDIYGLVGILAVATVFVGCVLALVGVALYGEEDERETYKNDA